jgi:hypothetical protein
MNYQQKYLKYKTKYLNLKQVGSGKYAYLKYSVDHDGNLLNNGIPEHRTTSTGSTDNIIMKDDFRAVFNGNKVCLSINPINFKDLFKKINKTTCDYDQLLVFILNNKDITDKIPENIKDSSKILLFSDIMSKQIFLRFLFLDKYYKIIFPPNFKSIFLATWNTNYSGKIFTPVIYKIYIKFAIFSGIIFSYDIKDIYGFIKTKIENPDNNLLCVDFNKTIFFHILQDIIITIKQIYNEIAKDTNLAGRKIALTPTDSMRIIPHLKHIYQTECKLYDYVVQIEKQNILNNANPNNFDKIIDNKTSSFRYSGCLKQKTK